MSVPGPVTPARRRSLAAGAAAAEVRSGGLRPLPTAARGDSRAARTAWRELGVELTCSPAPTRRPETGDFTLHLRVRPAGRRRALVVALVSVPAEAPASSRRWPRAHIPASRFEREVHDLLGLVPSGHPDLRRLALHQFWPEGYHPLRRDAAPRRDFDRRRPAVSRSGGSRARASSRSRWGRCMPASSSPATSASASRARRSSTSRRAWASSTRAPRSSSRRCRFARTPELAERVSGDTSVAHALAYCQALEALAGARRAAAGGLAAGGRCSSSSGSTTTSATSG